GGEKLKTTGKALRPLNRQTVIHGAALRGNHRNRTGEARGGERIVWDGFQTGQGGGQAVQLSLGGSSEVERQILSGRDARSLVQNGLGGQMHGMHAEVANFQ